MDEIFNVAIKRSLEEGITLSPEALASIELKARNAKRSLQIVRFVKISLVAASLLVMFSFSISFFRNKEASFADAIDLLAEIDGVQSAVADAKNSQELLLAWQEAPLCE
ncbi:MAG: hypothetical protein J6S51_01825 [Kiritimatiellae bacterium]|nr:hypothetical protein [Kiritimatiellia bacterium]